MPQAKDLHSILFSNDFLHVVSTGNDRVLRYKFKDERIDLSSVKTLWNPNESPGKSNTHHLNAICKHKGVVLVSAFGHVQSIPIRLLVDQASLFNIFPLLLA
ncbi:hypothetical protein KKD61_01815 [Patescibacteria group bacterium]|nr:hypothetical protein [Patescibacteria group bacterium]